MKRFLISSFFAFFLLPQVNFACSCLVPETFCQSLVSDTDTIADVIFRGEIVETTSSGKQIDVKQILFGDEIDSNFLLSPTFCTVYFSGLETGKEYVIALIKGQTRYHPPHCSVFYLEIENEKVIGKIAPGVESIPYEDLGDLGICGIPLGPLSLDENILVYPNPTSDEIRIKNSGNTLFIDDVEMTVYDIAGRKLETHIKLNGLLPDEEWIVNIQDYPHGMYLLKLSSFFDERTIKLVKL